MGCYERKLAKFKGLLCVTVLICIHSAGASLSPQHSHNPWPEEILFIKPPPEKSISKVKLHSESLEKAKNMSCGQLGIDQTCLIVQSEVDYAVQFQYHSMECDNCSLIPHKLLKPHGSQEIVLSFSSLGTTWKIADENDMTICGLSDNYFGENSFYRVVVKNDTGCSLICDKEPEAVYMPLLIALGVYCLLGLIWFVGNQIYRSVFFNNLFHRNSLDDLAAAFSSSSTIEEKKKAPQQRLRALDTMRGIVIALMIFVNYGGGKYTFFHHAHWNGLMVADIVFPWFIWLMGMSMAFALKSQLRKVVSKKKIFLQIVRRSLTLFGLGIVLNTIGTDPIDLTTLRIPGVLQRFGVSYFVVATIHLFYASADDEANSDSPLRDIISFGGEWLIMLAILTTHILLMFFVHSPECPRGYFGPGGLHDQGLYENCTGGAAGYIDRVILGSSHIYQTPSPKAIYHTSQPYDPEGILGYLTSIFLVFLGLQAGKIILMHKEPTARLIRWMLWSLFTGCCAGVLCCFSKNDGWIPVNKNLWSTSFILATGSLAFAFLSICFYIIDVKKFWSGAPFFQAGMNAIALYIGHEITTNMFPWKWYVQPTHMNALFMDLWGASLWVIIAVWMHRKNIFITV